MSDSDFKKIINKVMAAVIIFTVINLLVVVGGVWKSSSDNSIINRYQDKEIQETKVDLRDFEKDTKEQYFYLTEAIKEINDKL